MHSVHQMRCVCNWNSIANINALQFSDLKFYMRNHTMGNDTFCKQLVQRAQQLKVHMHEISWSRLFWDVNNELDCLCLALRFYFLWWALMLGIRINVTCYTQAQYAHIVFLRILNMSTRNNTNMHVYCRAQVALTERVLIAKSPSNKQKKFVCLLR
jgi:hypothetical protein